MDQPPSSVLRLSYTTGLVGHGVLGRDLVGNNTGPRVVSGRINRIIADHLATHTSIRSLGSRRHPLVVSNYSAAGVAEYKAFLIATSRGSPVSVTPFRLGTYA